MKVTVGTFNLNNLFSRYNFKGEIDAIKHEDTSVDGEIKYEFTSGDTFKIRTYRGNLVKAKDDDDTMRVVDRILAMNLDVLAVQEIEDIDTLRVFNRDQLNGMYKYVVLVEGNDPRLIDLGILSNLPLGAVTSWQKEVHPDDPTQPIFGRDLLQVEVFNPSRSERLFTVFNNHLKSHFVDFRDDPVAGALANNTRRRQQAETVARILKERVRADASYLVVGDMNDGVDSEFLEPLIGDTTLKLVNGLESPEETQPAKKDTPPPATKAWTHRFKESGKPASYELYDQIWLSNPLKNKQTAAKIDRRTRHGGDGSDHDPAWVELDI